jgi:hypothetical protein
MWQIMQFFNLNNGFFMFIATVVLVGITAYYARQSRLQVEQLRIQNYKEHSEQWTLKENLVNLFHHEIVINYQVIVVYLIALQYYGEDTQNEVREYFRRDLSDKFWTTLNNDALRCFSKDLMVQVVSYYSYVSEIDNFLCFESGDLIDLLKTRIVSTVKCLECLNEEVGVERNWSDEFEFNGLKVSVNPNSGELTVLYQLQPGA